MHTTAGFLILPLILISLAFTVQVKFEENGAMPETKAVAKALFSNPRKASSSQSSWHPSSSLTSMSSSSRLETSALVSTSTSSISLASISVSSRSTPSTLKSLISNSPALSSSSITSTCSIRSTSSTTFTLSSMRTPTLPSCCTMITESKTMATLSHHQKLDVPVGALVLEGIGAGGVRVADKTFDIPESDLVKTKEDGEGEPEIIMVATDAYIAISSASSPPPSSQPSVSSYVVVPKRSITFLQQQQFEIKLEVLAENPIETFSRRNGSVFFWLADLTSSNANEIKDDSVTYLCFLDKILPTDLDEMHLRKSKQRLKGQSGDAQQNGIFKRGLFTRQKTENVALRRVSQPQNVSWDNVITYDYLSVAGRGITVYVVDSGVNENHPQIARMRERDGPTFRWILADPFYQQNDTADHGTCIVTKVASEMFGTAKNANIVVVKIGDTGGFATSRLWSGLIGILNEIDNDQNLKGHVVVNISPTVFYSDFYTDPEHHAEIVLQYYNLLEQLLSMDAVVICASGNEDSLKVDVFPAAFAQVIETTKFKLAPLPLIVVGAATEDGMVAPYSRGRHSALDDVDVWAVGGGECASGISNGFREDEGTGAAAALVAGQAAIILASPDFYGYQPEPGRGKTPRNIKNVIRNSAYAREVFGPRILYNMVDYRSMADPEMTPRRKRQEASTKAFVAVTSTVTVTSTATSTTTSTSISTVTITSTSTTSDSVTTSRFPPGSKSTAGPFGLGDEVPCLFKNDGNSISVSMSWEDTNGGTLYGYTAQCNCDDGSYDLTMDYYDGSQDCTIPGVDGSRTAWCGWHKNNPLDGYYVNGVST